MKRPFKVWFGKMEGPWDDTKAAPINITIKPGAPGSSSFSPTRDVAVGELLANVEDYGYCGDEIRIAYYTVDLWIDTDDETSTTFNVRTSGARFGGVGWKWAPGVTSARQVLARAKEWARQSLHRAYDSGRLTV
jgi:hypothetical protein